MKYSESDICCIANIRRLCKYVQYVASAECLDDAVTEAVNTRRFWLNEPHTPS
jgi:hypothetical protein